MTVALGLALLLVAVIGARPAGAATLPETANPPATKESTPLCSPQCELITAPVRPPAGVEYEGGGPDGGFTPQELREAYGLPEHGGANVTIAVIDSRGDPSAAADLAVYREHFGLPECTEAGGCFRQLNENGEPRTNVQRGSWINEISLDLDMVSAACAECRIDLFEGVGVAGLLDAIETAVEMGDDVITNSWNMGFEEGNPANSAVNCETELCISQAREEEVDPRLDHPGVPILFSGGDYGYGVRFPATSPYVISVGGTRLLHEPADPRGWSEEVWSNTFYGKDRKGRGSGSGCSVFEPKPAWEADAACPGRVENDVAADADPRSPVSVYDSEEGGWEVNAGTSASAPFVAGVEGLSTESARRLGAKAFWEAGEEGKLFDVTTGSDGECTPPAEDAYWCAAETGFDGPTGWGTPDGGLSTAAAPTASADGTTTVSQTTATMRGTVDNQGNPTATTCAFQVAPPYDREFSEVLATVPCEPESVAGEGPNEVLGTVGGLSPRTPYLFRVEATNSAGGPVFSSAETFVTLPLAPTVTTGVATFVGRTGAKLTADVDNNSAPSGSTCSFRVVEADDPSFAAPYSTVPCSPETVEGDRATYVTGGAPDLSANTAYLYRVEATNEGGGPTIGEGEEFTTLPEPPTVSTGGADEITIGAAVLNGRVDDEGDAMGSVCGFEVTTVADENFRAPIATVSCDPETVPGEAEHAVTAAISGLTPLTEYRYRIEATNRGGSAIGADRTFTTEAEPRPEPEPEPGSGTGPVIVIGPPDEAELALLKASSAISTPSTVAGTAIDQAPAPSDEFTVGAPRVRAGAILLPVYVPGPGTLTVAGGGWVHGAKNQAIAAGEITVRVSLSPLARRRAGRDPKLRVSLQVSFVPTGGQSATKRLSVLVRRASAR